VNGPRVIALALDVTDPTSVAATAEAAPDASILINNSVLDPDTTKLREQLKTNLFGPLALSSTFADKHGATVDVAFVLVWLPVGGTHGVSKAALWNATDSMRLGLASRGVQAVGVYFGLVGTDMASFADRPESGPADIFIVVVH
jgi:NAD(P)-dependent dehydrogenase (short-subunit alcohol dehydrogenase family)